MDIIFNETLPVLEEFVKKGKARFIGVTGYPLETLKKAILGAPGRFDVQQFKLTIARIMYILFLL